MRQYLGVGGVAVDARYLLPAKAGDYYRVYLYYQIG
jgi:hypothetical protein